jgi:ATP-binding protein involved in chromosome partitioning
MDADVYGPNIPQMLGVTEQPEVTDDKKMIPPLAHGVKVMSMGMLVPPDQPIIWRGPMLHGAVQQFMRDVAWGELDYLVVDLPPGTGDVSLSMAQSVPVAGAVVVTTPQSVSVSDVRKAVGMYRQLNIPILGVIENMSCFIDSAGVRHELFGAGGGAKIAEFAEAPLLGQVPLEPKVRECGDGGTPIVQAAPDGPAAQEFARIAEALAERIAVDSFVRGGGKRAPQEQGPRRLKIVR